jgi:hypothetical protein
VQKVKWYGNAAAGTASYGGDSSVGDGDCDGSSSRNNSSSSNSNRNEQHEEATPIELAS